MGMDFLAKEYKGHDGGLTTHSVQHAVAPNKVVDCLNMYLDRLTNTWRKRNGYSRDNSSAISANAMRGIHRHYGATKYRVVANGTNVYSDDGAGTYSSILAAIASDTDCHFTSIEISGTLNTIMCNGNNQAVQKWNGTGSMSALGGSPPKGLALMVHKNFLWIAHATTAQQVVYSDLGDPESYPVNNFINVKTKGAGAIVGFAVHSDALIIFKTDSIWRVVGSSNDDFRLERVTSPTGAISQRSIVEGQGEVFFFGSDQMCYSLRGDTVSPIGLDVETTLAAIPSGGRAFTAGAYYKNVYYLSYRRATPTTNDRVLLFDALKRVWVGIYDWPVNCFVVQGGQGDSGELYAGQASNGFVLKLDNTTKDSTTTIQTLLQYRYEDQEEQSRIKRYASLLVNVQPFNGTLVVEVLLDYSTVTTVLASQSSTSNTSLWDTAVWDTAVWGGQSFHQYAYRIPTPNKGNSISVKLTNTDSDDTLYFYGYEVTYQPQSLRWTA
mgnify:CR=1 FL=1